MGVPPTWVRRILLAPLVIVAALVMLVLTPVWLLVALALTSLVPGRFRLPRVLWLVTVYLLWDAMLVIVMFGLWIGSGFGYALRRPGFVTAHYRLAGWGLRVLFRIFGGVLRLTITTTGADGGEAASGRAAFERLFSSRTPLVVASRHGGPGDSLILIHTLLNDVARQPRIVLKYTLQWDPAVDILLHRVPSRFIVPTGFGNRHIGGGLRVEEALTALAAGLGPDDAFVIFPEGGNVSPTRRRSRIDRLRAAGREAMAVRAEALRHVMAPQPGGMHAALDAAPDADVVFIAHTGLDRLVTLRDIWRELPMDKGITMRAWRVPRADVPEDLEARAAWLFDWFARIDAWIDAQPVVSA
ncbi:glycerol acyltransferase [Microbacterium sp. B35-04]|uniref:1-acyl-sn-glycerol-3-phosphate acyltransferase n=1 Tax=unclassified Microbacterium TaxID=2609290 RepID=UPI0013D404CF|nr:MULTISPECIES: 1-acyl-sn-glycerol-3-phosphate acyltransferase [unclassified Microbacterium]KAF2414739.1 glycerol acyltransferase [Microbacterium sp. B35-04]KAF2418424.1 glycerol acyltransferase [Microbacterium sp. B35-30]